MRALLDQFIARWRAFSPRERAGVAVLGALAMLAAVTFSFDRTLSAHDRAAEARMARARVDAVAEREQDETWRESVAQAAGRVWSWSVVETTPSIAQARALSELEALVASAGIGNATVEIVTLREAENETEVLPLEFAIEGDFDWNGFLALLSAMETAELSVVPVAVDVTGHADGAPRFSMNVRLAFLDEDAGT